MVVFSGGGERYLGRGLGKGGGARSGGIFGGGGGERYLGRGRGGGARSGGIFGGRGTWVGVWVEGEGLGVGVFSGGEVLWPGFG